MTSDNLPILAQALPLPVGVRLYSQAMIFERDLEWEEYKVLWNAMNDIRLTAELNIPFWMGDLLNKVEIQYGETYAQLVDSFDFASIGTLRNYKWVCGRVPPEMRLEISPRNDIPFTLAKVAAPIPDYEQRKHAIAMAMKNGLTTREFSNLISLPEAPMPKEYTIKDQIKDTLLAAFEAVARQDWELASGLIDKAIIMLGRL